MNNVTLHLFQSCRDHYNDYLAMCDDPDCTETARALQRARVAALYNVIESSGLEIPYAAFKEITRE